MHKEIKGTDMQWLAEGCWDFYFKHRRLSNARRYGTIAMVLLPLGMLMVAIGFIAAVNLACPETDYLRSMFSEFSEWVPPNIAVGGVLALIAFVLLSKEGAIERRERDKFVDHIIDQWEEGNKELPDNEAVAEYLKNQNLLTQSR